MGSSGLHHIIAIAADPQRKLDKSPKELGTNLFLPPWMESSYARIEGGLLSSTVLRKGAV